MPYQPEQTDLRASDADREAAVQRLRTAALEGRLDDDELEGRLSAAYSARWCSELARLTVDVTPPPAPPEPLTFVRPRSHVNPLAIASLICALLWFGWLGSVAAIVTGHVALSQIGRSAGTQSGRGVAIAGLLVGYFGLATLVATLSYAF